MRGGDSTLPHFAKSSDVPTFFWLLAVVAVAGALQVSSASAVLPHPIMPSDIVAKAATEKVRSEVKISLSIVKSLRLFDAVTTGQPDAQLIVPLIRHN